MNNHEFRKQLIHRAFQHSRQVLKLMDKFPQKRSARVISDQLLRAVTSIGANIIEAQAASSKKDFINYLNHALKSANETKFWLALARDLDRELITEINTLLKEREELAKIV